jgi:hypothetical protein
MPFDGSGNYVPPGAPDFPAVAGQVIVSSYYNAVINDLASALSLCITRDGQGKPSANIDWNGKNLTDVGAFAAASSSITGAISAGSLSVTGNGTIGGTLGVTGSLTAGSLVLGAALSAQYGGTGVNAATAANGQLLIGNGAGFALATLTAGANITITNNAGSITIAAAGGGGGGSTSFPLTLSNTGNGAASGSTFNGATGVTVSYNSIGAKPITPQIQTVTSAATVTPNFSNDQVNITAQAVALTLANPTGIAVDAWGLVIRIKDNGTAQTIAFGTQYRAIGVTLPTTTVAGKTLYIAAIYNAADTKWDIVAVAQQ